MSHSVIKRAQALKIVAGGMPVQDTFWWSGDGATDTVGSTSGAGVDRFGSQFVDDAVVDLLVTSFDGLTAIQFRAQAKGAFGQWAEIDPPIVLEGPSSALRFVAVGSGKVTILSAAVNVGVRIRVPVNASKASAEMVSDQR